MTRLSRPPIQLSGSVASVAANRRNFTDSNASFRRAVLNGGAGFGDDEAAAASRLIESFAE